LAGSKFKFPYSFYISIHIGRSIQFSHVPLALAIGEPQFTDVRLYVHDSAARNTQSARERERAAGTNYRRNVPIADIPPCLRC